jgi:hypothetical protein
MFGTSSMTALLLLLLPHLLLDAARAVQRQLASRLRQQVTA